MDHETTDQSEQAWAAWNVEANKVVNQAYDHFRDTIDPLLWQNALRFALDAEKAAERCPRRGCRAARACQVQFKAGARLDCAAGLSDETLQLAVRLTLFAHLAWFERWWADLAGGSETE